MDVQSGSFVGCLPHISVLRWWIWLMIKGKENFLHMPLGVVSSHVGIMSGCLFVWGCLLGPTSACLQISIHPHMPVTPPMYVPCSPGDIWGVPLPVCISCITVGICLHSSVSSFEYFYASLLISHIQNPYNVIVHILHIVILYFVSIFMKPQVSHPTNRAECLQLHEVYLGSLL